jgi:hypothetical protein
MTFQFTSKTNDVLLAAQQLALQHSHIELNPIHIAVALFSAEDGGIAQSLCSRVGISPNQVRKL